MDQNKSTARLAGVIYLIVVLTGIFSLAYVPGKLIITDDASLTFQNITSSETLFRLSILSSVICYTAFLLLPLVLFQLLKKINLYVAYLMVIFAIISVPISFINLINKLEILDMISGAPWLNHMTTPQLHSNVMQLLERYDNGNLLLQIFWGLWLFPFGYLVYNSGFLPKILGVLLMMGCIGYLINFTGHTVFINYSESGISAYVTKPASLGEIGICLWLMIMGIKTKKQS